VKLLTLVMSICRWWNFVWKTSVLFSSSVRENIKVLLDVVVEAGLTVLEILA